ncbi:hypothetical protein HPB49_007778 [Dermacentor silvarum]|uniref:Uncharacterized protein n=1 Tax=Dermacentor silvarum TaxID=543639 RepID=A0ACB8DX88_DERSI|nr:hypothetical protein HPB49_007778 [Dermacentor silvarum]
MTQPSAGAELIGGLPRTAWESIFELLDGASRLAFTKAATELTAVADCERVVKTVTFSSDTDERTLGEYCKKVNTKNLRQLRFTNCLAMPSDVLLGFVASCENLQELCVVNSVVEPPPLFRLLSKRLTSVKKLEWSLYEGHRYESSLEKDAVAETSTPCQLQIVKLQSMYVEVVATPLTEDFLEHVLNGCHSLQNLHVHAIRKDAVEGPMGDANVRLKMPRPGLRGFCYTCEWVPPPTGRLTPEPSYSFVLLDDVREMKTSLQGVRRAVVAVEADSEASRRFLGAAKHPEHWNDARSLSLVLLPPSQQVCLQRPLRAAPDFLKPMRKFLRICLANISELSLTKSHFALVCNFCLVVGPALSQLRSLALPPCAVNCEDSLQCLARSCRFLEELVVSNEETLPCAACKVPLMFTQRDFECLHGQTRLWRLSIAETARILSLGFLLGCRVTDLRFSLDSLVSGASSVFYFGPCHLLCANERLSTLTIEAHHVSLGQNPCFAARLAAAKTLRSLCLLTGAQAADRAVVNFIARMVEALPLLQLVHVHYLTGSTALKTMSWIRQQHEVVNTLPSGKEICWKGQLCDNSPCVGRCCCATSYIGVARPRNRY